MENLKKQTELICLFKAVTLTFLPASPYMCIPQLSQQTGKFWKQNEMQNWTFASQYSFICRVTKAMNSWPVFNIREFELFHI